MEQFSFKNRKVDTEILNRQPHQRKHLQSPPLLSKPGPILTIIILSLHKNAASFTTMHQTDRAELTTLENRICHKPISALDSMVAKRIDDVLFVVAYRVNVRVE